LLPARRHGHRGAMHRLHVASSLPGVGALLNEPAYLELRERYPHPLVADAIRDVIAEERESAQVHEPEARVAVVAARLEAWTAPRLRRVVNGTGVVLHTNLGRAPLSRAALERVSEIARGYSHVELDLDRGRRGDR